LDPVRVGLLGAGYWGTKVAREYGSIQGTSGKATLEWVADFSEDAIERIKVEIGSDRNYTTDYHRVLESDVDAVHIALPNQLHYEVAREALNLGKHVFVEKPMSLDSVQASHLASLAEERHLILQVGHVFRFNNSIHMMKRMINNGRIGTVFYAVLRWGSDIPPPRDRDIVFDLAPHPIDILNFLLGDWPVSTEAIGESFVRNGDSSEEMAFIQFQFPKRIIAQVYLSWIQHGLRERSVTVVGSEGTLVCDALNQAVKLYTHENTIDIPRKEFPNCRNLESKAGDVIADGNNPNNTIRDMEYNFIDTIQGGGLQLNDAVLAAKNVAALEAVVRSMRARRLSNVTPLPLKPDA